MRVLVTGGAGFVGRNLIPALAGHTVTVNDLPSRLGALPNARPGDVSLRCVCDYAMEDQQAVIHLAALAGVAQCAERPDLAVEWNVVGTANVLEAARAAGCRRVVLVSSAAAATPTNPYAASKAALEALGRAWGCTYRLEVVIVRPTNIYGPHCRGKQSVIPRWLGAVRAGEPLHLEGNHRRDYVYVGDVCAALVAAITATKLRQGATLVEVGSGVAVTLTELLHGVEVAVGRPLEVVVDPERAGDRHAPGADLSEAQYALGWMPQTTLAEGLARTWAWMQAGGES
jgi:UDP-glucose 4-epimerase